MQQFTVPQFIDVEDKIIGPITVRQFIIIIIAGLFLFLEYKLSDFALFLLLGIPTLAVFATFAFAKVNGVAFHYFMLNVIQTFKKPKLRVWIREIITNIAKEKDEKEITAPVVVAQKAPITRSHLSDLSLIIDTGGVYKGDNLKANPSFNNHN